MKKLSLIIVSALLLCGCSSLPSQNPPTAELQLTPLTCFDGKGLYIHYYPYDYQATYLTYLNPETAVQKLLCTKQGCEHIDYTCSSVAVRHSSLLGYYDNKLIFRDQATDSEIVNGEYTTTTIAASDKNGENYKIIGTVPYSYNMYDFNMYGDQLIFSTQKNNRRFLNSVNLKTGEIKQINKEPISDADNYLGTFKDFYFYFNINHDNTDRITYTIFKINITNGEISTLCTFDQFTDPTIFNTTDYSFSYYNGKIYSLYTNTQKGTDILTEVDCLTGESVVIDDNIPCTSPNGQRLDYAVLKGNLTIRAIENAYDLPSDDPKVIAYNLSSKTITGINLTYDSPDKSYTFPLFTSTVLGDYILVDYKYISSGIETYTDDKGKTYDLPMHKLVQALLPIEDYLNSVPNYKEITLDFS